MDQVKLKFVTSLENTELAHASFDQHQFPMHFHDTYVIQLVDYGCDRFDSDGQRYTAGPGDLVIIPPHSIHNGSPGCQQRLKYRAIYPSRRLIERICDAQACPFGIQQGLFRTNGRLLARFNAAFKCLTQADDKKAKRSFADLILSLLELDNSPTGRPNSDISSAIKKGLSYFHNHFDRTISLKELAEVCSLNPIQLIRVFRREVGMTPHRYMINYRVLVAKRGLQKFDKDLSQVALESGFADQSHMNRLFRRYFGITPGRYRMNFKDSLLQ